MLTKPRTPFKIRKDGYPLNEVDKPRVKGQLNITTSPFVAGVVPFYEEHKARQDAGYTIPEWRKLPAMDRAYEVAVRRTANLIEAYHMEDSQRKAK